MLGEGVLIRNGGGNGDILGGITIATFGRSTGNLRRRLSTNGGGNSDVNTTRLVEQRHRFRSGSTSPASASSKIPHPAQQPQIFIRENLWLNLCLADTTMTKGHFSSSASC